TIAYFIGSWASADIYYSETNPDLWLGASVGFAPLVAVILLVSFGENVKKYFSAAQGSPPAKQPPPNSQPS
ncbi:MAG: hypothetical protein AB7H97_17650, partial [Pseudobdellovibrionaceae bacterium]